MEPLIIATVIAVLWAVVYVLLKLAELRDHARDFVNNGPHLKTVKGFHQEALLATPKIFHWYYWNKIDQYYQRKRELYRDLERNGW